MFEYKFEKVDLKIWGKEPKQDYHNLIEENAQQGWRLVQIFAPGIASYGAPSYYEIIFERELK